MPPKSKKEQEEQAKRLQEEQKRKEEEEARLAIERKKYSSETLSTGLQLPASNQLIIDLSSQPVEFINQKLKEAILAIHPNLTDQPLIKTILKELLYYSIDTLDLFHLTHAKHVEGNEQQLLKARALIGIALKLMLNEHPSIGGRGKSKQSDEKLLKEIMGLHVTKGEGKLKVYDLKDVENVLNSIRKGYFNHYVLLFNFNQFQKRQSTSQTRIFISTPTSFRNQKDTPFTDLSHKKQEIKS